MTPGSIQGKAEADRIAPYLLRPVYEWTDGELRREISKHKTALGNLSDDVPADRNAIERRLKEYREELESRLETRRKPIGASAVLRGVYRSVLDTELESRALISKGCCHVGLFSKGPSNQYHDNHNHRSAKNNPTAKVKFENDKSLLHEAEIAEKEGRLRDAQLIRRKIGD